MGGPFKKPRARKIPIPNIGDRFGQLVVAGEHFFRNGRRDPLLPCRCDCGATTNVVVYHLRSGHTSSCGCLERHRSGPRAHVPLLEPGQKFDRWTVLYETARHGYFACRCECGNEKVVFVQALKGGRSRSCGCLAFALTRVRRTTHGFSGTRLGHIWATMRARCGNPNHDAYPYYGGRGITVCAEWISDLGAFARWAISAGWKPGLQVDRRNSDGPYSPQNCRIVTRQENMQNKRSNVFIVAFGESKCLAEWTRDSRCVVGHRCLGVRIRSGWPPERAITEPPKQRKR